VHMLMHCLFRHMFSARDREDPELWDLCCDIAAESVVDSMTYDVVARTHSPFREEWYERLESEVKILTAEKIYAWFLDRERNYAVEEALRREFTVDDHSFWQRLEDEQEPQKNPPGTPPGAPNNDGDQGKQETEQSSRDLKPVNPKEDEWKKNAEKIEADLDIMGKERSQEYGSLSRILRFESRKRTDYREFLQRFSVLREEAGIDPDSFDYGFYYYGMEMYGNMPLIEENEMREIRKVDSLVIAIDTSASCQKVLVQQFLNETADLLSGIGSFFKKTEIHLIECDDRVQNDRVITDLSQLQQYAQGFEVKGGFGTDFRPVFNYIEDLRAAGKLENLKGLMYFTDGFGEYPKKPTDYDTAFVFFRDEELDDTGVPDWAIKLFLTPEGMETEDRRGGTN
ncbi:MAG: metallopeptidase, partial [Lachnospiraceae bacterium]|nr:metallopeptidase [Lachnospiraceae bacterium]